MPRPICSRGQHSNTEAHVRSLRGYRSSLRHHGKHGQGSDPRVIGDDQLVPIHRRHPVLMRVLASPPAARRLLHHQLAFSVLTRPPEHTRSEEESPNVLAI